MMDRLTGEDVFNRLLGDTKISLRDWREHFQNETTYTKEYSLDEITLFVNLFVCTFDDKRKIVRRHIRKYLRFYHDKVAVAEQALEDERRKPLPQKPQARESAMWRKAKKQDDVMVARCILDIAEKCAIRFGYDYLLEEIEDARVDEAQEEQESSS